MAVAVPALPVIMPLIGLVTVNPVNVLTHVKEELTIFTASVVGVIV